jgi:hypothetical protein
MSMNAYRIESLIRPNDNYPKESVAKDMTNFCIIWFELLLHYNVKFEDVFPYEKCEE